MARGDSWDVVVVGGMNTDYLARGPALPTPGTGVEGDVFHVGAGGEGVSELWICYLLTEQYPCE